MTGFNAYYHKCKFIVNGTKEYCLGEILEKYLSKKFKDLEDKLYQCKRYLNTLHYPEDKEEAERCDNLFQEAIVFYDNLDALICSLPPYNSIDLRRNRLYDLLNEDIALWDWEDEETDGYEIDYIEHFNVRYPLDQQDDAESIDYIFKFNDKLKAFASEYITFIEDLLRVKNAFEPFLEKVHSQGKFLDNNETAAVYSEFISDTNRFFDVYKKLQPSGNIRLSYKVLEHKKSPILCEEYHFDTIGAFLYIELFKGLEQHYLPKRCDYCGRYFLLKGGYYSDYCTRSIKDMEGKVCRDMGHRKKYNDKVKNTPKLNIYMKAYKQHYARVLNRKMSKAEFREWADFALEMRQKAINGEIPFEEYKEIMRK